MTLSRTKRRGLGCLLLWAMSRLELCRIAYSFINLQAAQRGGLRGYRGYSQAAGGSLAGATQHWSGNLLGDRGIGRARCQLKAKKVDPEREAKRREALRLREEALKKAEMIRQQNQQKQAAPEPKEVEEEPEAEEREEEPPKPVAKPTKPVAVRAAIAEPVAKPPAKAAATPASSKEVVTQKAAAPVAKTAPQRSEQDTPGDSKESIMSMKVEELKAALREAGLKVSGVKADLQKRLLEHHGL